MNKQELYGNYFRFESGIMLKPKQGDVVFNSENDTVFFAYALVLEDILSQNDYNEQVKVELLAKNLEVIGKPGRYHRDHENQLKDPNSSDVSPNSKDNIMAMACLLKLAGNKNRLKNMAKAMFTSFGTFNNTKRFRMPFNPGTYTTLGLALPGFFSSLLALICLPVFLVNLIISLNRDNFSNHMLNFMELYMNKNVPGVGFLFRYYMKSMKKKYGRLSTLVNEHPSFKMNGVVNHPIAQMMDECEDKGLL